MCPACIATAAIVVVSTTSASGLAALAIKTLRVDRSASKPDQPAKTDVPRDHRW